MFDTRLARRLVLTYTRRGEFVIDFDADTVIGDVALATARRYVALTHRADIADLDRVTAPGGLILLRWPRDTGDTAPASLGDLLLACRLIAATAPTTLAVISQIVAGPPLAALLGAAAATRFAHDLCIYVTARPTGGDRFIYYASAAEVEDVVCARQASARPGYQVDILHD
jgi:hypothetical protein